MTTVRRSLARAAGVVTLTAIVASCASTPAKPASAPPAIATVPVPAVPPALNAPPELQDQHQKAWALLQGGDARGSAQAFVNILKGSPDFYPSETGLGYALLTAQLYPDAVSRFRAALFRDARYVPALEGLVEAELAQGHTTEAITALERLAPLAPDREAVRTRLEVVRLKEIQSYLDGARAARQAGRPDDARGLLEQALNRAPLNIAILSELAAVETERGSLETAELYAKRAISIDAKDAAGHAALGAVQEAKGRYGDALAAYTAAAVIDPRWNDTVARVRERAAPGTVPKEFRNLDSAPTVTRAEAAAFIGMQLDRLLASAPRRVFAVATDIRQHWAEPWIFAVTGAGVMEIFPNHTFQPAQLVRRDELAASLATLVEIAAARRPKELASWKQVRPKFADLPEMHLFYPPAALAVASGTMSIGEDARFNATRPVSGPDFVRAIKRIHEIAGR